MYYPLLRARQFELIALRELSKEDAIQDVVFPILEPVKKIKPNVQNNLDLAYKVFQEKNQSTYLILNPNDGEINVDGTHYLDYLSGLVDNNDVFRPAFRYKSSNGNYIRNSIVRYELQNCMLICSNDINTNNRDFTRVAEMDNIRVFNIEDPGRNRALGRYIRGLGKEFIRLDDPFERQLKNSDYLPISGHLFTEEHLYFHEDHFNGFSDYTVLPSKYIEGGSTPRAVVIHLTYLNETNQIWIKHFTSTTNDSIANVQGKFAEAAAKAVAFCREQDFNNSAIEELKNYFETQHYPGLGIVKKISMKNHIQIVADFLRS